MDQKLIALWASFKTKLAAAAKATSDFFGRNKVIFFVAIPLILLAKFRDIVMEYLTAKTDKEIAKDKVQNDVLENQVKAANTQADALVKKAQDTAASTKPVVDENWDKK